MMDLLPLSSIAANVSRAADNNSNYLQLQNVASRIQIVYDCVMNLFSRRPKASKANNAIIDKLREIGMRMTPQRMMIISVVESSNNHISAEEIYTQVTGKDPDVNISTVYRTLDTLEELKLVTKTDFGDGRVRYHPANKGHHHHLVCRECGRIIDLDEQVLSGLEETLLRDYNFIAEIRHLGIPGICVKCSRKNAKTD
jgi:Fur family ferric uptake transcriptional regulator